MNSSSLQNTILENTAELVCLHKYVLDTFSVRDRSALDHAAWSGACKQFHTRYDLLAFPGGYTGALDRIRNGDPEAMEAAVCFLEIRPYFFRSGYMFKDIMRICKKAPLTEAQMIRFAAIAERYALWKFQKRKAGP